MSGPVLPARFDPVIRVLVRRWIVHAGKMKGLAPLDAGPAATAMESAALVARPGFGKGDFKPRALAHDVGLLMRKNGVEKEILATPSSA